MTVTSKLFISDVPEKLTAGDSALSPGFQTLRLAEPLLRALRDAGYREPTPIQSQAIPPALLGRDIIGCARTGTGKTAAFALPLLHQLLAIPKDRQFRSACRAVILAPTRELATQISETIRTYSRHTSIRSHVIVGGMSQERQVRNLRQGVDILVATPGRFLDLFSQGHIHLDAVKFLVLDEFDRMLDQGFLPAIRRIVAAIPRDRQTFLFSATAPAAVEALSNKLLRQPVRVAVSEQASTPDQIEQSVWFVEPDAKRFVLHRLLKAEEIARAIVFTRTKRGASRVAEDLIGKGIRAEALHGDKSQSHRDKSLYRFRSGSVRVLVATDIAARGLDVNGITHVINYDLPVDPESYVHRIGRTARAGQSGTAISLCTAAERIALRRIERLINRKLAIVESGLLKSADFNPSHIVGRPTAVPPLADSSRRISRNSPSRYRSRRPRRYFVSRAET